MIVRQGSPLLFGQTLSRRFVLSDFWPDRSARDCRMDLGRSARRSFSTADAQVYLDADPAGGLSDASAFDEGFYF